MQLFDLTGKTALVTGCSRGLDKSESAIELAQYKIRINTLNPRPLQFHLYGSMFQHHWELWKEKISVAFLRIPKDLDGSLLYLALNKVSRYVTGSYITVDGELQ